MLIKSEFVCLGTCGYQDSLTLTAIHSTFCQTNGAPFLKFTTISASIHCYKHDIPVVTSTFSQTTYINIFTNAKQHSKTVTISSLFYTKFIQLYFSNKCSMYKMHVYGIKNKLTQHLRPDNIPYSKTVGPSMHTEI